MPMEDAQTSSF